MLPLHLIWEQRPFLSHCKAKQCGSINGLAVRCMEPSRPLAGPSEVPIGMETVPIARRISKDVPIHRKAASLPVLMRLHLNAEY